MLEAVGMAEGSSKSLDGIELVAALCAAGSIAVLGLIIAFVVAEGAPALASGILTLENRWEPEYDRYGLYTLLASSIAVAVGALAISVPAGISSAVFVVEVLPPKLRDFVKVPIELLGAIPSVVYGFVGYKVIVPTISSAFGIYYGQTALAASLVLAVMTVPTILSLSSEVLASVPLEYREASLALGATKWQTIRHVVLPAAAPGVMTGIVLSMARVAGETAAILFTACFYTMKGLPTSPLDPVLTLSYYLYVLVMYKPGYLDPSEVFALALVLFALTIALTSAAFAIRAYYRRRWARWT